MSTKQARGTKRTCQNDECGSRFYDLNRHPITCPICGSIYELASAPMAAAVAEEKRPGRPKKPVVFEDAEAAPAAAEGDGEEALADIEGEEPIAAEEEEAFLEEEEEEGGDVSNIIGGPVAEGEEEV